MRLRIAISGHTLDGAGMFGYAGEVELREMPHEAKLRLQAAALAELGRRAQNAGHLLTCITITWEAPDGPTMP